MRLAIRGLQSCRPTYQSTSTNTNILAITSKGTAGHVYVFLDNTSNTSISATVNLSALLTSGTGTEWEFNSSHTDVVLGRPTLKTGKWPSRWIQLPLNCSSSKMRT